METRPGAKNDLTGLAIHLVVHLHVESFIETSKHCWVAREFVSGGSGAEFVEVPGWGGWEHEMSHDGCEIHETEGEDKAEEVVIVFDRGEEKGSSYEQKWEGGVDGVWHGGEYVKCWMAVVMICKPVHRTAQKSVNVWEKGYIYGWSVRWGDDFGADGEKNKPEEDRNEMYE